MNEQLVYVTWASGKRDQVARIVRELKTQVIVRYCSLAADGSIVDGGQDVRFYWRDKNFRKCGEEMAGQILRAMAAVDAEQAAKREAAEVEFEAMIARRRAQFKDFAAELMTMDDYGMGQIEFETDRGKLVRCTFVLEVRESSINCDYGYWSLENRGDRLAWSGPSSSGVSRMFDYVVERDDAGERSFRYVQPKDARQRVLAAMVDRIAGW